MFNKIMDFYETIMIYIGLFKSNEERLEIIIQIQGGGVNVVC